MNIQEADSQFQSLLQLPVSQNINSYFFTQLDQVVQSINQLGANLSPQKLYSYLYDQKFLPDILIDKVEKHKQDRTSLAIIELLGKIFKGDFVKIGALKCFSVLFLFLIPLIMNELTDQVRRFQEGTADVDANKITLYSILLLGVTLIQALLDTQFSYRICQLEVQCRVFLIDTLYNSAMSRKANQPKKQQEEHKSDLMNLVSIDVNSVLNFFVSFHECWSLVLKLIVGLALLYIQMKSAVFIGFATALCLMMINFWVAQKIGFCYGQGMIQKDRRMQLLREFVSYSKQIKYLKWELQWLDNITEVRQKEFNYVSISKWLDSLCVLFWSVTNTLISTTTLFYFAQSSELESQNVFTMIYLFSLLTGPLNALPWTVTGMLQAKTSFKRLDEFLLEPSEFNDFQKQLAEYNSPHYFQPPLLLKCKDAVFGWVPDQVESEQSSSHTKIFIEDLQQQEQQFYLSVPNLDLQSGKLIYVIGQTGQGKSAFLNMIMKQLTLIKGESELIYHGDFSYVPQTHWVKQGSLRDNIAFEDINMKRYLECLDCSELYLDILGYEELDRFEVGPEGSKLSGGQKQRLSLCRALYNERDMYILDDIFSSLDPNVSDTIFQKSILNYLKKRKKCSIIMAINDGYLNRYSDYADQIILIENGVVVTEEKAIQNYLSKLELKKEPIKIGQSRINELATKIYKNQFHPQQEEEQERDTKGSIKFYLQQIGLINTTLILISLVLMQVSFNLYDSWLNSYLNGQPFFLLTNFAATLLLLTSIDVLVKSVRAITFAYGNLVQAKHIFKDLLKRVIYGKAAFFDKEDSGQILSRLSGDQNVVDNQFPFELNLLCNNAVNFIGTFAILIFMKWLLIFPTILSIYIFYKLQSQYRPTSLPLRRLEAQTGAELLNQINDQFKGVQVIVAFNKSKVFHEVFSDALRNVIRVGWASKCVGLWLQIRLQAVAAFIVFCILMITIFSVYFPDNFLKIPPSTLQLLLYYSLTKISLFRDLTLSMTTCERELISYERIRKYFKYNIESLDCCESNIQVENLELRNVWLDYSQQLEETQVGQREATMALKGVDVKIEGGQRVAFCGRTGSGKSSILSMIFRMYQQTKGEVLINGSSAGNLSDWRSLISVIPQNGLVFKGTVKQNLKVDDIEKINKISILLFQDVPIDFDLEQQIETDGKNLSQGMKQVISFVRVLLEDRQIICLDEATASVDSQIEEWVAKLTFYSFLKILNKLKSLKGKTIITISHRLEGLKDYDRIFYLEKGVILEQGSFDELVQLDGGFNKLRNME